MAESKALANYRVIPVDRYAKGFLEWGIGFLANSYSFSKKYIFTRCLVVGFASDSLYGVCYDSFRKLYLEQKMRSDRKFDKAAFEAALEGIFTDPSLEESLYDFCEAMITYISGRFGNRKQYIVARCILSGMFSDELFGPKFSIMKTVYPEVGDPAGIVSSKKFIYDVIGNY